ncbi:3'(2'),5'-bisphosphate nucleotidase CysQ [Ancylomarina sp. 16SWW S1-10-2]|uniref:3'(2'),5'-bisphosphate nucleotidase CysQ n=1 Tax=Ancylomarina sp. 16SWW S1-10-2 TaxID=2499681 RepID=UPI0012AD4FE8|nr:3'(2'),5'-bisphosphate nucleotidase CysQ [Ancylomarina sp. 16SWW S1-10-2]MRT93308.1 3'(2'),5'-bisphosphate nucleotidase [Ancylomarina sp. 16SWW S1-10-2]
MDKEYRMKLLSAAIEACIKAGKEILDVYKMDDFHVQLKSDNSPLTIADQRAHNAIVSVLDKLDIPILSEEGTHLPFEERKAWKACWIVDPLDGTKEFIKRNDEFTVNVALVKDGKAVAGVIYIPVLKQLYFADELIGSFRCDEITEFTGLEELMSVSKQLPIKQDRTGIRVVASRSHMNDETRLFIDSLKGNGDEVEIVTKGSSLKLCLIAEGSADVYPRYAPTMEWDIAAGHAIVSASGGNITHLNSDEELSYNKADLLNPWFMCKR